jgi:hypothetical protein
MLVLWFKNAQEIDAQMLEIDAQMLEIDAQLVYKSREIYLLTNA